MLTEHKSAVNKELKEHTDFVNIQKQQIEQLRAEID
jgi:hypothetical protein